MEKIRVTINKKTGKIKAEASGYVGTSCEHALDFIKNLGLETNVSNKPEFDSIQTVEGEVSNG